MWYSIVAFAIILLDRITKAWALHACAQTYTITSWFSCSLAFNRGVSWSLFHSESSVIFGMVTLLVMFVMAGVMLHAYQSYSAGTLIWPEVCILAGGLSNLIDRYIYGAVIDFLGFEYGSFSWPLFNVADIFIVMGVMLLMVTLLQDEVTAS